MTESAYFYASIVFVAAAVSLLATFYARRIRLRSSLRTAFTFFMGSIAFWASCYAMELLSMTFGAKMFWTNLQYIGIAMAPLAFFVFSLYYSSEEKYLARPLWLILILKYIFMLAFVWTDGWHHLMRQDLILLAEPFPELDFTIGVTFKAILMIDYGFLLMGSFMIVRSIFRSRNILRTQSILILFAVLLTWVSNIFEILGADPIPHLSMTPFTFILSGLLMFLALSRFRLLSFNPVDERFIFDNLRDGIVFVNTDLRILETNPAATDYILNQEEQLIGSKLEDHLPEIKDIDLQCGKEVNLDIERIRDGDSNYFTIKVFAVQEEQGSFTRGYLLVFRDITHRKLTKIALRKSEGRLQALFENQLLGIATLDLDGKYLRFNHRWLEIAECDREYVVGKQFFDFSCPEMRKRNEDEFQQFLMGEVSFMQGQRRILCQGNRHRWVQFSLSSIIDDDGNKLGFSEVMIDVSGLINVQHALEQSETKYRSVAEQANDGIMIFQDKKIKYINPQMAKLLGYQVSELQGELFLPLFAEESRSLVKERYQRRIQGEVVPARYEVIMKGKEGNLIEVEINAGIMDYESEKADLIILRDITLQKEAEGELEAKNSELERSIRQANQLRTLAERRAIEMEALQKTGLMVSSVLKDQVDVELFLEQLHKVLPSESASVFILKEDYLELTGYRSEHSAEDLFGLRLPLNKHNPGSDVIKHKSPMILDEIPEIYTIFSRKPYQNTRSWLGVPLLIKEKVIGLLSLESSDIGRFDAENARLAGSFAFQMAIALENARLFDEVQRLAVTDPLTTLFNRRYFYTLTSKEFKRYQRYAVPFSLIMLDIDHFKKVNDTYGHLIGDQVLQAIADLFRQHLRDVDISCRYGGEEFVAALPETKIEEARILAERLREVVEQTPLITDSGLIRATISIGVAQVDERSENIDQLLNRADTALYQAKDAGRNKVVVYQD